MSDSPVAFTELPSIQGDLGSVWKLFSCDSPGFSGFGEAYITSVNTLAVKGWKYHHRMVLNLIVLQGKVKFVFYIPSRSSFRETVISSEHLCRLTVPAKTIFAFQGLEEHNKILNLASIPHDRLEVKSYPLEMFNYANWD